MSAFIGVVLGFILFMGLCHHLFGLAGDIFLIVLFAAIGLVGWIKRV